MLPFLGSVAVISLSGVMMPGPMFAVTVAKSYKSQSAGIKIALGHALVEIPVMLLIYFGLAQFFYEEPVQIGLYHLLRETGVAERLPVRIVPQQHSRIFD